MKPFAYRRSMALGGAREGGARPLAGGTDLLPLLKQGLVAADTLVDVASAPDPRARSVERLAGGGLRLGALVTLAEVARHPEVRRECAALAEAAAASATPQIRNVATVGGNLCQWNRCWYFRSGVACRVTGGDDCPARVGDHRHHAIFEPGACIAVHPSDPAVALAALGARVEVQGPDGSVRTTAIQSFLRPVEPGSPEQAALGPGEVVWAVVVPGPTQRRRSAYEKAMDRRAWAFALVSAAVVVREEADGTVADASIALGAVAAVPWRAEAAAAVLRGRKLTAELAQEAAARAVDGATPLPGNAYKVPLAIGLVRAALARLLEPVPGPA